MGGGMLGFDRKMGKKMYEQILAQAIDAVVSIDDSNNVTFFNRAAEVFWGYRADEVIGKNVKMLVPVEIQSKHDGFIEANRTTGQDKIVGTSREVEVTRKDGTKVWGNLSLYQRWRSVVKSIIPHSFGILRKNTNSAR